MLDVWKKVLAEIEQTIPSGQFSTWFTGTEIISLEDGKIVLGSPNTFKRKHLETKFTTVIHDAFESCGVSVKNIEYVLIQNNTKPRATPTKPATKQSSINSLDESSEIRKTFRQREPQTGLKPDYTLDNFVIGSNNNLATSVARNIVENPGTNYNPFFLYGGSGLGKTHLVQAIGNELLRKNPNLKIKYMPVSSFYADFINAIRANKGMEFSEKFKKLDVLIIDDFQMIVNKDSSQEEFFNIFNELYQLNKQIIVTSDRLPEQIKTVDERLASRLSQAGAFDIQMPRFEDKCAILKAKAEFMGVEIEDEAIEYLAENVTTNIRLLERNFKTLLAMADLKQMTPLEIIHGGYIEVTPTRRSKTVSAKVIVDKVAKFYSLSTKELCSKSRVANIKNARQVAMYLLSKELSMSTPKIAIEVGVKDHTTVMHGIKMVEERTKLDFALRDQIAAIKEKIYE